MFYLTGTPAWLKALFPKGLVWNGDPNHRAVYLTFDDGPHPEITPFVTEQLDRINAKGTFFCIGENVQKFPEVVPELLAGGHRIGNHTFNHPNGWTTKTPQYLDNIARADDLIKSNLFRPPYGKITQKQIAAIRAKFPAMEIVMWSAVTGDFDESKTGEWCKRVAIRYVVPGNIIVFHDSEKAFPRLKIALPGLIDFIGENSWVTKIL